MRFFSPCSRAALAFSAITLVSAAQAPQVANRIAAQPDLGRQTRLSGHLPPWVNPALDTGPMAETTTLRLTVVLSRPPALQAAFEQLLADQQDPASASFHHWLTPAQIGQQFGPTLEDVGAITRWLSASGMNVAEISPARTSITVDTSAGVAAQAFATTFHGFSLEGQEHLSATSEPVIPSAFASVIASVQGLTDVPVHPMYGVRPAKPRDARAQSRADSSGTLEPLYSNSTNTVHYVFPGDFSTIYDLNPITAAGYNGAGIRVAVIGRSQIALSDITELQDLAGLPDNTPNVVLVPGSPDPGVVSGDTGESTLDVGRVATTAPGAKVDLVIAASSAGGISAALQYNINTLLDPVMSLSYGACEASAGAAVVSFVDTLFAQAAAEGISTFISAGDAAAAGCSGNFSTPTGRETLNMGNFFCSSSYVTCVGGTQFNDANPATFWSANNTDTYTSALGYIPEGAWNQPTTTNANGVTVFQVGGTGSGPSAFIRKPSWQTGTGVPADGARDTPDLAFSSSSHDGFFGCLASMGSDFDCNKGGGVIFYGTSIANPSMAAVSAILDQRIGHPQGNLNPLLYRLAASAPSAFHDVTPASSGVANCTTATATICNNSVASPTSISGGLPGYPLQIGYDLVTGLGSLDIANFIDAALAAGLSVSQTAVSASPATILAGQTAVFTASVTSANPATPTGTIQFLSNGTPFGSPITLANGTASSGPTAFPAAGTYAITAIYSGDSVSAGSTSPPLNFVVSPLAGISSLTVTASPTSLTLSSSAANTATSTITAATPDSFTGSVSLACAVTPTAGVPPTCSLSPSTLAFNSAQSVNATLTVATITPRARPAPSTLAGRVPVDSPRPFPRNLPFAALLLLLVPAARRFGVRRNLPPLLALTVLLGTTLLALSGCGTSGSFIGGTGPGQTLTGTSPGTYVVTVTATSGSTVATTTVGVTIQ